MKSKSNSSNKQFSIFLNHLKTYFKSSPFASNSSLKIFNPSTLLKKNIQNCSITCKKVSIYNLII